MGNHTVRADEVGRLDGGTGVDGPAGVVQVDAGTGGEHIHVGIPQGVDGAHILPVAVEAVSGQPFPGAEHIGDDVFAEVVGGVGVSLVRDEVFPQLGPGEHIDAHGGKVALGLGGLFLKFVDEVVFVHIHDAKARGFLHGDLQNGDGTRGTHLLVMLHHFGVVHFVDVVAGQDDHIFRVIHIQKTDVLIDGVGRALVPGALIPFAHIGGEDMYAAVGSVKIPRLAGADIAVELQRTVLGEHTHGVNARIDAVGQGKVDNTELAAKGDGRLGHMAGQRVQSAALTAGQQHGYAFFFHFGHLKVWFLPCRRLRAARVGK